MYDRKSMKADDFINHDEIMETLSYAEANKDNRALIESLIEKAKSILMIFVKGSKMELIN